VDARLYNLRFLKPVDEDYLAEILNRYRTVVFIEEGLRSGGFGEYAADLAVRRDRGAVRAAGGRVLVLAAEDPFARQGPEQSRGRSPGLGTREELLKRNGLDGRGIAAAVKAFLDTPLV
jgi:1-deoxy-D-xylulose-5-phosphate synthase